MKLKRVPPKRFLFLIGLPIEICKLIHQYAMSDTFKQLIKFTRGIRHHLLMMSHKYYISPPHPNRIREGPGSNVRGYFTEDKPSVLKDGEIMYLFKPRVATVWFGRWRYKRCKKNWCVIRTNRDLFLKTGLYLLCDLRKQRNIDPRDLTIE